MCLPRGTADGRAGEGADRAAGGGLAAAGGAADGAHGGAAGQAEDAQQLESPAGAGDLG